jgi:hypothetical protein
VFKIHKNITLPKSKLDINKKKKKQEENTKNLLEGSLSFFIASMSN